MKDYKIIFRPQRGGLSEAMEEAKEFDSISEMKSYCVAECGKAFNENEITIEYYCYDERIDWETFICCTERWGRERFDTPQAFGFCTIRGRR